MFQLRTRSCQCTMFRHLLLYCVLMHLSGCVMGEFNFTIGNSEEAAVTFKETVELNMTVTYSDLLGALSLESVDTSVVTLTETVEFIIDENTTFPFSTLVSIHGQFVGRGGVRIVQDSKEISSRIVNVGPPFQELGNIATIILVVWLVISYVVMAAKVEPRVLWERIKPPWGIIIGMLCQFIIMPPVAFALAKCFDMTGAAAVGLVLVGTCPGGFFSNIEVLLLDGDLVLSLAMTTFSTFIAVGMMPLNLFIYAQPFIDGDGRLETPFKELLIQLCGLVLPLVIGVPFFYKFPKARKFCLKLVKPFTFLLMVLGVVLYIPAQYYVFFGDWKVWVTSSILTLIGAFFGMAVARIANFNYITSVTIAIETGCQNTLLAVSVAKLFYVAPESDVVAVIPLLIAIVSGIEGFIVVFFYYLYLFLTKKPTKVAPDEEGQPPEKKDGPTGEDGDSSRGDDELNSSTKSKKKLVNDFVTAEDDFKSQQFDGQERTEHEDSPPPTPKKPQEAKRKRGYIVDDIFKD
ncbi:ileal sodium/bile acid cotransporter-like [Patiria miniata]|uniref:Ileal sodium/bile acid cotransporter n=1 Tax=Patiria miniata TaxID=46514 RepID=A0A914AWJ2_PATMI|nr:ileal sodium/bile acid cotransporter-like [Patiria miniata]